MIAKKKSRDRKKGLESQEAFRLECGLSREAEPASAGLVGSVHVSDVRFSAAVVCDTMRPLSGAAGSGKTGPSDSISARGSNIGGQRRVGRSCKSTGRRLVRGLTRPAVEGRMERISRVGGGTGPFRFLAFSGAASRSVRFDPLHLFSVASGGAPADFGVRDGPGGEVKRC